jgi:hypothetical protein
MDSNAEDIRRQMQQARRRVRADAEDVVEGARRLADWRYYPRQFPWLTLGAAAAVAFAAVPRRNEVVRPDTETLEKLVREHKLLLEARPAAAPAKQGVAAALLAAAGAALMRDGLACARQELGRRFHKALIHRADPERR